VPEAVVSDDGPRLSVIVPVYNQEQSIVENLRVIRERVTATLGEPVEVIVVSDGSIDRTEEELAANRLEGVRVLHYDRNLGKGYAVKVGALAARGRWIGYVDADLDLDPGALGDYVHIAERDGLDFAIGSKRHPESIVAYPRSRRVASWLFQQYVHLLLRLDVRDTQVGLKVFRREVADEVLPLLLVKRYAFDLELLAVARAFGFGRVRELPIRLDYQFAGSGVRASAVLVALADALAVFYRLRILRTYQRKRSIVGPYGWSRPSGYLPDVAIVTSDETVVQRLDWPVSVVTPARGEQPRAVAQRATADVLAFVEPGAVPSGNFVSATVPFLARDTVGAVVTSKVAPLHGSLRERAAAAVRESRLGGGSLYFRFMPGNIRYVRDFPTASFVARRELLLDIPEDASAAAVVTTLADRGDLVVYTPEAFLVEQVEPLFRRHLRKSADYGRERGVAFRRRGFSALRPTSSVAILWGGFLAFGWLLALAGAALWAWVAALVLYAFALLMSGVAASLSFRSLRVGVLALAGMALTHVALAWSFLDGLVRG
jgi:glycosyltransferase involved in cell wall biosynthesis